MSAPPDSRHEGTETPRGPGRPRQGEHAEDVRARLIAAATELFSRRGFGEVGVREVAGAAGVTPAMVSYYFGDKQGLYAAMLESVFDRLIDRVAALARHEADEGGDPLSAFMRMHIATLAEEPWVPQLILREVLGGEGPLRERFIGEFARRMSAMVLSLLREGIAEGRLRADLDPRLAMLSLMGLCVFPYLSHPVSGPVLDIELDESFRDRLIEHTVKLFARGALAEEHTS
jgi:AcrR family transcriptional regulator